MKRVVLHSRWTPLFVLIFICGLAAAILFPVFAHARENARRASCQSNLKQIALGIQQYEQDYGNRFPLTHVNSLSQVKAAVARSKGNSDFSVPYGWADGFQPYFKSTCSLMCPSEASPPSSMGDVTRPGFVDYWMNKNLSGFDSSKLTAPQSVFMLGDGEGSDDSTAQYNKKDLSAAPVSNLYSPNQPPWFERHLGGANYAFADGHVKWLTKDEVSTAPNAPYTFAPH
jgi:prepilin-type processing-associated H-X9-DG protein